MTTAHRSPGSKAPGKPAQLLRKADRLQQRSPFLAVAVATYRKFSDDQAGNLAALIAYCAFASIFPLLLVLVTILNLVVRHNVKLRDQLLHSAFSQFPGIDTSLIHGLSSAGLALVIGIGLTLYAARGVAVAIQNALNKVWGVPRYERPGFPWSLLRSFALIAVVGPGMIITITLSSVAGGAGHLGGVLARLAAVAVSLVLNFGVFWLAFRIATAKEIATRDLRLSAILAAIGWQVLQLVSGFIIGHLRAGTSAYGIFSVVLGLLAWFYLQAQLTLYVVELNVVRVRRLWPRSLAPPPLTEADLQAYELYAQERQLWPEVDIEVQPAGPPDDHSAGQQRQ